MRSRVFLGAAVACLVVGAAACSGESTGTVETVPGDANGEEAPFFVVDPQATGPLTLAELQISIPRDIDARMSGTQRACFFAAVQRRALEAGDPADIDPDDFPYWDNKVDRESWRGLTNRMQRALVAQAIISWAMIDC